jgi:hypothetical protein
MCEVKSDMVMMAHTVQSSSSIQFDELGKSLLSVEVSANIIANS